jgi:hypothetical protein
MVMKWWMVWQVANGDEWCKQMINGEKVPDESW